MISYETDFYAWTQDQAAFLRAGQLNDIDTLNILEEIEAMGRREKRELQSRLVVLLVHLLKWTYQPVRRGKSWELTIKVQRDEFQDVLSENPSLKAKFPELLEHAYDLSRLKTAIETNLDVSIFPDTCPWSYAQLINNAFYPN
jgi:hypothetical protein